VRAGGAVELGLGERGEGEVGANNSNLSEVTVAVELLQSYAVMDIRETIKTTTARGHRQQWKGIPGE